MIPGEDRRRVVSRRFEPIDERRGRGEGASKRLPVMVARLRVGGDPPASSSPARS
jgi:hypothetical protein